MEKEKKVRLSIEMNENDHTYLKLCCAKLRVTLKDFVVNAMIDRIDSYEDDWMQSVYEKRDEEPLEFIPTDALISELGLREVLHV